MTTATNNASDGSTANPDPAVNLSVVHLLASAVSALEESLETLAPTVPADGVADLHAAIAECVGTRRTLNAVTYGRNCVVCHFAHRDTTPPAELTDAINRATPYAVLLLCRQIVASIDIEAAGIPSGPAAVLASRIDELGQYAVDALFRHVEGTAAEIVGQRLRRSPGELLA